MSIIGGFLFATIGGYIILWIAIDKLAWAYVREKKEERSLSPMLGILERASYWAAILLEVPEWVAIWLAMKVAVHWRSQQERKDPTDNLYLIGNLLSLGLGLIGAWITLGTITIP